MPGFIQITTTTDSGAAAERIANELVARRLAGCVQIIGPIQSLYRWQGAIERAEEWLLLIKTAAERYPAVEAAIRELHSYECPEIIATPITQGSGAYLKWLGEQM
ncbi:MAG TPA: divalent-cation tolerance protein CutA [Lacipirellula sp.]